MPIIFFVTFINQFQFSGFEKAKVKKRFGYEAWRVLKRLFFNKHKCYLCAIMFNFTTSPAMLYKPLLWVVFIVVKVLFSIT